MPHPTELIGKPAPQFTLPASSSERISLADFKGSKVVLYFYPRADTPGCTKEACGFRDVRQEFDRLGAVILGVSPDDVEAVKKFARKYGLDFPLLADADHAVAEKYGVWQQKNMYGRKYFGVARTTFIMGSDGRVQHVFERVKPEGHEAKVLAWLHDNAG